MSSGGCDVPVRQRASAAQCCNSNTSLSLCDCLFVYLGLPSDPGLPPITDLANKPPTRPIVRGELIGTRKRGYGIRAPYRRTSLWWNLAPVCVVFEMGFHSGNRPIYIYMHISGMFSYSIQEPQGYAPPNWFSKSKVVLQRILWGIPHCTLSFEPIRFLHY